jgi:hypothetical protein
VAAPQYQKLIVRFNEIVIAVGRMSEILLLTEVEQGEPARMQAR